MNAVPPTERSATLAARPPTQPLPFPWWRLQEAARLEERAERLQAAGSLMARASQVSRRAVLIVLGIATVCFFGTLLLSQVVRESVDLSFLNFVVLLSFALGATALFAGAPACLLLTFLATSFNIASRPVEAEAREIREEHAALHVPEATEARS